MHPVQREALKKKIFKQSFSVASLIKIKRLTNGKL